MEAEERQRRRHRTSAHHVTLGARGRGRAIAAGRDIIAEQTLEDKLGARLLLLRRRRRRRARVR